MEKKERTFGPLITVQLASGGNDKHCDLYPHGSYHNIRYDQDGNRWVDGRVDCITKTYPLVETVMPVSTKTCQYCKNQFDLNWPFINVDKPDESCVRCFERRNIVDRETYRAILRDELRIELERTK